MRRPFKRSRLVVGVALVAALAASALVGTVGNAGATRSVRGFDGSTVKVASIGVAAQFEKGVTIGVQSRIKRFNEDNEIKGVKIEWTEFANDGQDNATALNEVRRLVTQEGVFAIVGDTSANNPGDYLKQQKVPYYGWAFDNTYCSPKPDTSIYGFGFNGCLVPAAPSVMPNNALASYTYVSEKTGKKNPTLAMFSNDTQSGKNAVKYQSISYGGVGYDIVATNNQMPIPPVADYTPYAQAMLTADDGNPPDAIVCLLSTDCIAMYNQIKATGYTGTYISSLYSDLLVKAMDGSAANVAFVPLDSTSNNAGLEQMKEDVDAYEAGSSSKIDSGMVAGYTSTDMFITALKAVAKKGKSSITPEAVQKQSMNQTWQIEGLAGPTTYPQSTVSSYPSSAAEVVSDGTTWVTKVPYKCSKKQYKVK